MTTLPSTILARAIALMPTLDAAEVPSVLLAALDTAADQSNAVALVHAMALRQVAMSAGQGDRGFFENKSALKCWEAAPGRTHAEAIAVLAEAQRRLEAVGR